jgi:alpha-tubulin suppressor-like RCC1 family protein
VIYKGPPICRVAAGSEFSVIADMLGNLYTFGSPEYGQLGHNTDGKYFVTNTKLGFACETRPRRVMVFIDKSRDGPVNALTDVEVTDVACGQNHVVVLDKKGRVFTWGFGGYGRLGHDENKDELVPRLVKFFDGPNRGAVNIAAGSTFTLAVNKLGMLYLWGQNKHTGDATMYPKPVHDLSGWNIRSIGCCNKSIVIAADNSVISWGTFPTYGELGYGASSVKTSTIPQEMKPLEGIYIHKVGCGWGHTLLIARNDTDDDHKKLETVPEFVP